MTRQLQLELTAHHGKNYLVVVRQNAFLLFKHIFYILQLIADTICYVLVFQNSKTASASG